MVPKQNIVTQISHSRIERILYHSKRSHPNFEKVEKHFNQLASFYRQSHKRNCHFKNYLTKLAQEKGPDGKPKLYRLSKIFKVRWVSSADKSYETYINNWKTTVGHLQEIQHPSVLPNTKFDKKTVTKARRLEKFARDKNALLTIMVEKDVIVVLKHESLILQLKGVSFLGQSERQKILRKNLQKQKTNQGGKSVKKFLRQCKCQKTKFVLQNGRMQKKISRRKVKCLTIERFTESHVSWKGIDLFENRKKYEPVSLFIDRFLDETLQSTNFYMPEEEDLVHHVAIINHQTWPIKVRDLVTNVHDHRRSFLFLAKKFNMMTEVPLILQGWRTFLQTLSGDEEYFFTIKLLNPTAFWEHVMTHYELEPLFQRLVSINKV